MVWCCWLRGMVSE